LSAGNVVHRAIEVPQPYTAMRLVSSGWSYNSVVVRHQKLDAVSESDYDY